MKQGIDTLARSLSDTDVTVTRIMAIKACGSGVHFFELDPQLFCDVFGRQKISDQARVAAFASCENV
jgi:hypothetical protein